MESSELCSIRTAGGAAHTQVSADRLDEQLGWGAGQGQSESAPYLVKTVADAAELWGELAGRTDDGLEKALRDLQKVPLVLLQVLTWFQPGSTEVRRLVRALVWRIY